MASDFLTSQMRHLTTPLMEGLGAGARGHSRAKQIQRPDETAQRGTSFSDLVADTVSDAALRTRAAVKAQNNTSEGRPPSKELPIANKKVSPSLDRSSVLKREVESQKADQKRLTDNQGRNQIEKKARESDSLKRKRTQKDMSETSEADKLNKKKSLRKKRSASLSKVAAFVGQGAEAAKKSAALKLLTGDYTGVTSDAIPQIVAKSGFIRGAISADVESFMQEPKSVSKILSQLDLEVSLESQAEKLGVDLEEQVSPSEFLKAIGIDPQEIIAELTRLKNGLPNEGLSKYMEKADLFNKELSLSGNAAMAVDKDDISSRLSSASKKHKAEDLLGGMVGIKPQIADTNSAESTAKGFGEKTTSGLNQNDSGDAVIQNRSDYESPGSSQASPMSVSLIDPLTGDEGKVDDSMTRKGNSAAYGLKHENKNQPLGVDLATQLAASRAIAVSDVQNMKTAKAVELRQGGSGLDKSPVIPNSIIPASPEAMAAQATSVTHGVDGIGPDKTAQAGVDPKLSAADTSLKVMMTRFQKSLGGESSVNVERIEGDSPEKLSAQIRHTTSELADQLSRNRLGLESAPKISPEPSSQIARQQSLDAVASIQEKFDHDLRRQPTMFEAALGESKARTKNAMGDGLTSGSRFNTNTFAGTAAKTLGLSANKSEQNKISVGFGSEASAPTEKGSSLPLDFGSLGDGGDISNIGGDKINSNDIRSEGIAREMKSPISRQEQSKVDNVAGGKYDMQDYGKETTGFRARIMDKIDAMTAARRSSATINLDSAQTGRLSLAINISGSQVDLKVMSSSEEVRNMFGSEMPKLGEALALQNLQLRNVENQDLSDRGEHDSDERFADQSDQRDQHQDQGHFFQKQGAETIRGIAANARRHLSTSEMAMKSTSALLSKLNSSGLGSTRIQVLA